MANDQKQQFCECGYLYVTARIQRINESIAQNYTQLLNEYAILRDCENNSLTEIDQFYVPTMYR